MPVSVKAVAVAAVSVVAIGLVATYAVTRGNGDIFAPCRTVVVAGGTSNIGGPFTLMNAEGKPVTDKDVITVPSLIYFGYTFCPDVCPLHAARNAEAVDALEEMGFEVNPVFISVDPRRATPQQLGDFTGAIQPRMIGLTGTKAQIDAVAKEYRVIYQVPEKPADDFYTVSHTVLSYLVMPGRGVVEFFSGNATADEIATRSACYLNIAAEAA